MSGIVAGFETGVGLILACVVVVFFCLVVFDACRSK
jgi:hypothetical protein